MRPSLVWFAALLLIVSAAGVARGTEEGLPPYLATGSRVGEVSDTTAIVWARLTASPTRVEPPPPRPEPATAAEVRAVPLADAEVDRLEGACPGAPGRLRVRYGVREPLDDASETEWIEVTAASDYTARVRLSGLRPSTEYHYAIESTGPGGEPRHGTFRGRFWTAPAAGEPTDLGFCVMTCQGYHDRGHPDGHAIYPAMRALRPRFAMLTGDLVYYDSDAPRAVTPRLARYHWERMFSLPRLVAFNREVATYWLKDDHDTLNNDSWPGARMGDFTFAEGQSIFRQQAPMVDGPPYRTFRHGRDLQVWLTDGRDYRSSNRMPDGPGKTIWGPEQKAWFFRTVRESDATWKVLISPTPLVGPDRPSKNDNHANEGFRHEGDEIRDWLRRNAPGNFFVVCGDRHWQYHSVHPVTGLHEFGVGAASDEHAGGTPGLDPAYHRFHRVGGGFLSIEVRPDGGQSAIRFEHRDVNGAVVYAFQRRRGLGE